VRRNATPPPLREIIRRSPLHMPRSVGEIRISQANMKSTRAPRFVSALSVDADSESAISEVIRTLEHGLQDQRPDLVCAFVSHHHGTAIEDLGPRLAKSLNATTVLGCTGESIVGAEREIERGAALSVFAGVLPGTDVREFGVSVQARTEGAFEFAGTPPQVRDVRRASVILFADPYSFPADDYLQVLNETMPGVPAIGGMASGGSGPGQNLLITAEGLADRGAIGVVIEGDVEVLSIVSQGCRPVAKPLVITSCRDNVILKLGGKPALQALMDVLQSLPSDDQKLLQRGPFVGLAIDASKSCFDRGDFLVRGIVGIDRAQNTIAIADNGIRPGMTVQFLVRDAASAGEDLLQLVKDRTGQAPSDANALGALVFSCNGRGTRMFPRPHHDISCIQSAFDSRLPAAGFFAMGEIGPVGGRNFLHGFTASVALFRERNS
jgi:small ligand-binding sensory domain FIST